MATKWWPRLMADRTGLLSHSPDMVYAVLVIVFLSRALICVKGGNASLHDHEQQHPHLQQIDALYRTAERWGETPNPSLPTQTSAPVSLRLQAVADSSDNV